MKQKIERDNLFSKLYIKDEPLILFNIWDAASAKCVEESGAKAIATSSWSVAKTYGYDDGEILPLDLAIANIKRIVDAVDLPVTVDFEGGYANTLPDLGKNISTVIDTGIAGINFEDQIVGENSMYAIEEQCNRIALIRKTANEKSIPLFINARTDIFFQTDPSAHTEKLLEEALERASSYAKVGADGFFVPGLSKLDYIVKLCDLSPIPINVMLVSKDLSIKMLKDAGVARISCGPSPFIQVMNTLKESARIALISQNNKLQIVAESFLILDLDLKGMQKINYIWHTKFSFHPINLDSLKTPSKNLLFSKTLYCNVVFEQFKSVIVASLNSFFQNVDDVFFIHCILTNQAHYSRVFLINPATSLLKLGQSQLTFITLAIHGQGPYGRRHYSVPKIKKKLSHPWRGCCYFYNPLPNHPWLGVQQGEAALRLFLPHPNSQSCEFVELPSGVLKS